MSKTVKSEEQAKQGRKGITVLKVLIVAIALALVAWYGIEFIFADSQSGSMVPDQSS